MINSEKKIEELAKILGNTDGIITTEAIKLLRNERPFKGAIGLLTSFYNSTKDKSAKKATEEFLNDIKDQEAVEEVINEIKKPWKTETLNMLVASCWQSGLNYSEYCTLLAEIFMNKDYVTAIECLTVIQESIHNLSSEKKDQIKKILVNDHLVGGKEKAELVVELKAILES
jgi:hypothetical protein